MDKFGRLMLGNTCIAIGARAFNMIDRLMFAICGAVVLAAGIAVLIVERTVGWAIPVIATLFALGLFAANIMAERDRNKMLKHYERSNKIVADAIAANDKRWEKVATGQR
jgi:hypothetical protein